MRRRHGLRGGVACLVLAYGLAASAETITYTYDSLGRLIRTSTSGGPNSGLVTGLGYDPADNRVGYTSSTTGAAMPGSTTVPAPVIPSFSVSNAAAVAEGGTLVFTITKSGATPLTYSVRYATANGTAAAGSDYTAKAGMLVFAGSEMSKTVSVPTTEDVMGEANETVLLNLSLPSGGATITDSQGSGTITNDDGALNTPPVANTDSTSMTTCSYKTVNVTANDTDADGDYPLTVISATGNSRVGASVASATSVSLSSTLQTGATSVSYTIKDSRGVTDSGTISVTVTSGGSCNSPFEPLEG